jgi:hypothetical protein
MLDRTPLYPFVVAAVPVVMSFSVNQHELGASDLIRPLAASLFGMAVVLLLCRLLLGSIARAALAAVVAALFVFGYGPIWRAALAADVGHATFLLTWSAAAAVVFAVTIWRMRRTERDVSRLTSPLNTLTTLALAVPVAHLVFGLGEARSGEDARPEAPARVAPRAPTEGPRPDIYFIVLDGYGRQDILERSFGVDNSAFVEFLRSRGFFVADRSHSNYMWTHLSLTGTLNMDYAFLEQVVGPPGETPNDKAGYQKLVRRCSKHIGQSRVQQILESHGYRVVRPSASGFNVTREGAGEVVAKGLSLTEFEQALWGETLLAPVTRKLFGRSPHDQAYERVIEALRLLPEVARSESPKFVFSHIVCPHNPFFLDSDGSKRAPSPKYDAHTWHTDQSAVDGFAAWYRDGYGRQVQGLNGYVMKAIDGILAHSSTPPIIILQGDHGPALHLSFDVTKADVEERFANLSAIYLAGQSPEDLYPEMSNVNTFRYVLGHFFGEELPLLEDRAFFSQFNGDFQEVTDRVKKKVD